MRLEPKPLRENDAFAFTGERLDEARVLSAADARRLLAARNPTGRPNADVLREFVGASADGEEVIRWALDFPAALHPSEAPLYAAPFAAGQRAGIAPVSPHHDAALRNALARLSRFLACPLAAAGSGAAFAWVEGDVTPDSSLLVWARDDDFSFGVLNSRVFSAWSEAVALAGNPSAALRAFPFPWPPATPLSALSRVQEEHRFDLSRAGRSESPDAIEEAVLRAYQWPADLRDHEIVDRLRALHAARAS